MYDTIGPRDATQASSSSKNTVSANIVSLEEQEFY